MGKRRVFVTVDGRFAGIIAVADPIKATTAGQSSDCTKRAFRS